LEISKIIEVLKILRDKITDDSDVAWTRYESPGHLRQDIDKNIELLTTGNLSSLSDLQLMFAPTGVFQEISISNGWGDEFLKISQTFDRYSQN
jgi:hypothetical protein